jgi:hypothetical protein
MVTANTTRFFGFAYSPEIFKYGLSADQFIVSSIVRSNKSRQWPWLNHLARWRNQIEDFYIVLYNHLYT